MTFSLAAQVIFGSGHRLFSFLFDMIDIFSTMLIYLIFIRPTNTFSLLPRVHSCNVIINTRFISSRIQNHHHYCAYAFPRLYLMFFKVWFALLHLKKSSFFSSFVCLFVVVVAIFTINWFVGFDNGCIYLLQNYKYCFRHPYLVHKTSKHWQLGLLIFWPLTNSNSWFFSLSSILKMISRDT